MEAEQAAGLEIERSQLLDSDGVRAFVASRASLCARVGAAPWEVREVGDGNLNFVWIVTGAAGGVVVKQAPPYIRLVPSLSLATSRSAFEHSALRYQRSHCTQLVPEVYEYDAERSIIAMEFLHPHIILRQGLIQRRVYPGLSVSLGAFLAHTLYHSSDFHLAPEEKRRRIAAFALNGLVHLTEEPFVTHRATHNVHTGAAALAGAVAHVQAALPVRAAVEQLKEHFRAHAQALLHVLTPGDLHTGSVMVALGKVSVIDPEFAFFGPMGFDIGALLANLIVSAVRHAFIEKDQDRDIGQKLFVADAASQTSLEGHGDSLPLSEKYSDYVFDTIKEVWETFVSEFSRLWSEAVDRDVSPENHMKEDVLTGEQERTSAFPFTRPYSSFRSESERQYAQKHYFRLILNDSLGFAAIKIMRRIIGVAKLADLQTLPETLRAQVEVFLLAFAEKLLLQRDTLTIDEVISLARAVQ